MSAQSRDKLNIAVAGICPSMVDISCSLTPKQFTECSDVLGLEPGGWREIISPDALREVFRIMNWTAHNDGNTLLQNQGSEYAISAGSSVFGMLSATSPSLRRNSVVTSAIPVSVNGETDPLFRYFLDATTASGIQHCGYTITGNNPVGLVLTTENNSEKMLATFRGVTPGFAPDEIISNINPNYLFVDAYEMIPESVLGGSIHELISSGRYRVALSLGNRAILAGTLASTIREHIDDGNIHIIAGNRDEYSAVYPELSSETLNGANFLDHPVHNSVTSALMTDGANGLTGKKHGAGASIPAVQVDEREIINTSGAGDTAMGVFCDGVLHGRDIHTTLSQAALLAAQVLRQPGSRIL